MRVFRRNAPYSANGKTNFLYTQNKAGVYIIYKNGVPVYVGMSGYNVYKTMYRHFQSWKDNSQVRVTYSKLNGITCRVILCTKEQASRLEKALILKYKPKDNPNKYTFFALKPTHKKILDDFTGTPVESCPF